jgi:hypothetical protein
MLDVLNKHLSEEKAGCTVNKWIEDLQQEERDAFASVKANNAKIRLAGLYKDLNAESELPFKLTAFRSHMRGYCTCPN